MSLFSFPLIHAEELKAWFDQEMTAWINNNYPMEADRNTILYPQESPVPPNASFIGAIGGWGDFFESTATTTVPNAANGDASFQSGQIRRDAIITGSTIVDLISGHAALECTRWRKIRLQRTVTGTDPFPATSVSYKERRAGRLKTQWRAPGFRTPFQYVYIGTNFVITYDMLSAFVQLVRLEWKRVSIDNHFLLTATVCHASCHGNCHNSRGRR